MKKNRFTCNVSFSSFFVLLFLSSVSYGAHPLITDDTGTQGRGKYQVEINAESGHDREKDEGVTIKETGLEASGTFSLGIRDNMDVVLGLPYQWNRTREDGELSSEEDGISDMSLELKWRYYESREWSFAVKPGMTLPTGDDEKGLGTGRTTYSACFIITKQVEPWAFHFNFGYVRNLNKSDERKDIWHINAASEVQAYDALKLVANAGIEKNPDKASKTDPAFILGGVIYSITDAVDIDFGLKAALNKPETDYSILAGAAYKF